MPLDASDCIDCQFFSKARRECGINVLPVASHVCALEISISKSYLAGIALGESAHAHLNPAQSPLERF